MKSALSEVELLRRLRMCRADMVTAVCQTSEPPHRSTLKELAELQLVIAAVEGVISDKSDVVFQYEFASDVLVKAPPIAPAIRTRAQDTETLPN